MEKELTKVFTVCDGQIGTTGYCYKCMQLAQTTSSYCGRLIEVPVSPSEDKTAAQFFNNLNDHRSVKWEGLSDGGKWERAIDAIEFWGKVCRNKAIEEAIKVATENGTVRIDLVSTLNKLKA